MTSRSKVKTENGGSACLDTVLSRLLQQRTLPASSSTAAGVAVRKIYCYHVARWKFALFFRMTVITFRRHQPNSSLVHSLFRRHFNSDVKILPPDVSPEKKTLFNSHSHFVKLQYELCRIFATKTSTRNVSNNCLSCKDSHGPVTSQATCSSFGKTSRSCFYCTCKMTATSWL